MSELGSVLIKSVNGTFFENLEQMSRVAANILSHNTYFNSGLESAFIKSVKQTSFEGLGQMSRVAADIYHTTHTLFPDLSQHLLSRSTELLLKALDRY